MDFKAEKTTQEIAARNKKLMDNLLSIIGDGHNTLMRFEKEATDNGRFPSKDLRALMDVVWKLCAEPPVGKLRDLYSDLFQKAGIYLSTGPHNDINYQEKAEWARSLSTIAEKAKNELSESIRNEEFSEDELRLPAGIGCFPREEQSIEKENEYLKKEENMMMVALPKDSLLSNEYDEDIVSTEDAADEIIEKFDAEKDMEKKLIIFADVSNAADFQVDKGGCGANLTRIMTDHLLLDENGNVKPNAREILEQAADVVAGWRLTAYRKMKESGNEDERWWDEFLRAETLARTLDMLPRSFRGLDGLMGEMIGKAMKKKASEEEINGMHEIDMVGSGKISGKRQHALKNLYLSALSERYPNLVTGDDYANSLLAIRRGLSNVLIFSEKYKYNNELSEISIKLGTLAEITKNRSNGRSQDMSRSYAKYTAESIASFMEKEALSTDWFKEDNDLRTDMLMALNLADQDEWEKFSEREELLRERAEKIKLGREELTDFFNAQSSSSSDTLNKLIAANKGTEEERTTKLSNIIEKRYGLGKEFSTRLAAAVKVQLARYKDPVDHWDSTAAFLNETLGKLSDQSMSDFSISSKGGELKAEYVPKLRESSLKMMQSVKKWNSPEAEYAVKLKALLDAPEALDEMKEMFDTKKKYRMLNWNSSEYNDAKEAVDSFTKERNKLMRMTAGFKGRELTDDERKQLDDQIRKTGIKMDECIESLQEYVSKEGTGEMEDKAQAAGLARIAGAKGMLNVFIRAGEIELNVAGMQENIKKDSVKVKKISELYQEEYKKTGKEGGKDRHRRAASATRDKAKAPQAPVQKR